MFFCLVFTAADFYGWPCVCPTASCHISGRRGIGKEQQEPCLIFLNAAFADAVSYPKKVDTVFFMVCLLLLGNDYLFSAGVYVFRTCVYGSRKTRVYIFKFNRQMCLLISGKDNAPYNPYK